MSSLWVVLDTRSQVGALRVGRVSEDDDVAAAALELTVEWPDGTVERLKLSKYFRKLRLDSLSAMVELAPEQLTKELEASPLPFARALAEKPRQRLRSRQLIDLVTVRAQVDPQGDVPLSGGVSRHRAVSCVDYAALSSGMTTSSTWSLFMVSSSRMECSEK